MTISRRLLLRSAFSGYQPLIRAYIGQGLRKHLAELSESPMQALTDSLRKQGIPDQVIADAIADANHKTLAAQ